VYTDKASLFQPMLSPGWKEEEPGPKNETQMGRALRELGIEWIAACVEGSAPFNSESHI
jgi:hypothetical protein